MNRDDESHFDDETMKACVQPPDWRSLAQRLAEALREAITHSDASDDEVSCCQWHALLAEFDAAERAAEAK